MEDVLDLYHAPYDRRHPQVCFDEKMVQLVADARPALPVAPGQPRRQDYEYVRQGTCNLFMFFEPARGIRHVEVTARRTKVDFAECMRLLVDEYFPDAEVIRVVLDNLNTHRLASLYDAFAPETARRLARKLEFHYTPTHGSWLNMAEIEWKVLSDQCLDRRIATMDDLKQEVEAWEIARNLRRAKINWLFSTEDARSKLHRLYPAPS